MGWADVKKSCRTGGWDLRVRSKLERVGRIGYSPLRSLSILESSSSRDHSEGLFLASNKWDRSQEWKP